MANKSRAARIWPEIVILVAIMIMYVVLGAVLNEAGSLTLRLYLTINSRLVSTLSNWQYLIGWAGDLIILSGVGWLIFKSQGSNLFKAIYLGLPLVYFNVAGGLGLINLKMMTNPIAAILIMLGVNLLILGGISWFVRKFKLPWFFYLVILPNLTIYLYLLFMYLVFGGTS